MTVWDDYQWAGATRRSEGQGLGGGSRRAGVKFLAAFNLSPCGLYAFKRIAVAANNALETHMADNNSAFGWSRTGSRPLRIILLDGPICRTWATGISESTGRSLQSKPSRHMLRKSAPSLVSQLRRSLQITKAAFLTRFTARPLNATPTPQSGGIDEDG